MNNVYNPKEIYSIRGDMCYVSIIYFNRLLLFMLEIVTTIIHTVVIDQRELRYVYQI
jgi:hypothetical protein